MKLNEEGVSLLQSNTLHEKQSLLISHKNKKKNLKRQESKNVTFKGDSKKKNTSSDFR